MVDNHIVTIYRILRRHIEIGRIGWLHLIATRFLYLLSTTIDTKIKPKWVVMIHGELIKLTDQTSKSKLSCPPILSKILAHALRDKSLVPDLDLHEPSPTEPHVEDFMLSS